MTIYTYSFGFFAVVLIGISKAGFAGGTGILAVPLFCLAFGPRQAVAVLLPILCACDLISLYYYRRNFEPRPLLFSIPGAVFGIGLGALVLGSVNESHLKRLVGAIAAFFVLYRLVGILVGRKGSACKPGISTGSLFGAAAGFFSTLAHAAGPIMAAYLLPQDLGRRKYVGTTVVFFALVNHLKLVPYGFLNLFELPNLSFSLSLLPAVPLGVWLGVWLNRRIREDVFLVTVYVLLFLTGMKLLGVRWLGQ